MSSLFTNSPYSPHRQNQDPNSPSPWNVPSPLGSAYDSLTLPPINPSSNYDQELPSFDQNPQFFDALPRLASPSLFLPREPSSSSSHSHNSRDLPPPSNQQARRPNPIISEYRIRDSESPDPFEEFVDLTPPRSPVEMPPRPRSSRIQTRSSSVVDLTESSPQVPTKKRKRGDAGEGRAVKAPKKEPSTGNNSRKGSLGDIEVVDLENVETQKEYEEFKAKQQAEAMRLQNEEEANRPMKLAEFQCIICMDNPTDLTVTHCGHLFCSECLHSALFAGDKKNCPVCRTMINTGKPGQKQPKNGIFALEMKLMTANKKGKQPVRAR